MRCSAYNSDLLLLARCGTRLAQVLTGQIDPLQILFGERSSATMEHLYESGVLARISNALMQAVVSNIVDGVPPDRCLRILEIGAGTGGTTTDLLPWLPAERTEYVFTDVSETFLQKAEVPQVPVCPIPASGYRTGPHGPGLRGTLVRCSDRIQRHSRHA